ncbi:hypothetical protein IKP85_07130 [bacterium]|nr:hypothetical protein [bacterium]
MKKTLVVLVAAMVMSMGAAQAATSSTPISDWLNKATAPITKAEKDTADSIAAQKAEAKARKEAQKKAAAERKAAYKAEKAQLKKSLNEQKSFWKKLFTWDWD